MRELSKIYSKFIMFLVHGGKQWQKRVSKILIQSNSILSESQTSKLLCAPRPHFMRFHHSPYQIVLDLVVSVYFCIPLPLPLLTKLINMRAENTYLKSGFFVCVFFFLKALLRTSLVVHWLRLCAPNVGDTGSIPGQGTRSHSLQRRARRN